MTSLHTSPAPRWDWAAASNLCLRETRRILGTSASAEDAAQEAVIRAWCHRGACRSPERPESWIIMIAHREALRAIRRTRDHEEYPEAVGGADSAATAALSLTIRQAVARLEAEDRLLLFARYWQDRTQEDIATGLGLPEGTVKVRLHRARGRLREALEER